MTVLWAVIKRELQSYLLTPIGLVYCLVFIALANALTFYVGGFFEREIADLRPFFQFHPWLYLLLVPALGMRLWAEEFQTGSAELLLTLPVTTGQTVVGKFLAGWFVIGIALVLTFPIWVTVNVLGAPDNGVILTSYLASWLLAGGFLSISTWISAATHNQVVAFTVSCTVCFALLMLGMPWLLAAITSVMPEGFLTVLRSMSILSHYQSMARGLISLVDLGYFVGLILTCLLGNWAVIEHRRAA